MLTRHRVLDLLLLLVLLPGDLSFVLGLAKRARALSSRMIRRVTSVARRAARTALGGEIPFVSHVSGDARVGGALAVPGGAATARPGAAASGAAGSAAAQRGG